MRIFKDKIIGWLISLFRKEETWSGQKLEYVLCVSSNNKDRVPIRMVTKSLDHLKKAYKKYPDESIFYMGVKKGDDREDIKAWAVFSKGLGEVVRSKEKAFGSLYGFVSKIRKN